MLGCVYSSGAQRDGPAAGPGGERKHRAAPRRPAAKVRPGRGGEETLSAEVRPVPVRPDLTGPLQRPPAGPFTSAPAPRASLRPCGSHCCWGCPAGRTRRLPVASLRGPASSARPGLPQGRAGLWARPGTAVGGERGHPGAIRVDQSGLP